ALHRNDEDGDADDRADPQLRQDIQPEGTFQREQWNDEQQDKQSVCQQAVKAGAVDGNILRVLGVKNPCGADVGGHKDSSNKHLCFMRRRLKRPAEVAPPSGGLYFDLLKMSIKCLVVMMFLL